MMKSMLAKEPVRWFLLLWIAMAVVEALLGSNMQAISTFGRSPGGPPHSIISSGVCVVLNHTLPPSSTLIFLLLATLYSFLLWSGLSERVQLRFFWLYFLLQGLLVAVMQWMLEEPFLALNFYLVLTLCAVVMFKRAAPALLVGMSCLLLFFVLLGIGIHLETHVATLWLNIWSFSDLTTIVFFVLGYLILYTQQSQLLKTVYTRAGEELTDPQEGCKLRNTKITSGDQPCLGVRQCLPYTIYRVRANPCKRLPRS